MKKTLYINLLNVIHYIWNEFYCICSYTHKCVKLLKSLSISINYVHEPDASVKPQCRLIISLGICVSWRLVLNHLMLQRKNTI